MSAGEGRWACAERTEAAGVFSRGSRGGMLRKITGPVLETRSREGVLRKWICKRIVFGRPGSFGDQEKSLFTCSGSAKRYIALGSPEWYCSSMKRVWVNKAGSFKEALDFDTAYYLSLSSEERVEGVQFLREEYFKSKGIEFREDGKRLRRVFRIIKQA